MKGLRKQIKTREEAERIVDRISGWSGKPRWNMSLARYKEGLLRLLDRATTPDARTVIQEKLSDLKEAGVSHEETQRIMARNMQQVRAKAWEKWKTKNYNVVMGLLSGGQFQEVEEILHKAQRLAFDTKSFNEMALYWEKLLNYYLARYTHEIDMAGTGKRKIFQEELSKWLTNAVESYEAAGEFGKAAGAKETYERIVMSQYGIEIWLKTYVGDAISLNRGVVRKWFQEKNWDEIKKFLLDVELRARITNDHDVLSDNWLALAKSFSQTEPESRSKNTHMNFFLRKAFEEARKARNKEKQETALKLAKGLRYIE